MEVSARGAIRGESGEPQGGFGACGDIHKSALAAHFGFYPAGMGGVDLDGRIGESVCEVDSECVEGGLGGVVGEELRVVDGGAGIGVEGEGAKDGSEVHYAGGFGFCEQGQERLGKFDETEEIDVEGAAESFRGNGGGCVAGPVARFELNGGVVNEDVEAAELRLDMRGGGGDVGGICDVDCQWEGETGGEGVRGGGGAFEGTGCENYVGAQECKPARGFEADAAVGASD